MWTAGTLKLESAASRGTYQEIRFLGSGATQTLIYILKVFSHRFLNVLKVCNLPVLWG